MSDAPSTCSATGRVKGILLDLGGVLYTGKTAIPGAERALSRLRDFHLPLGFITNTTRRSRQQVLAELRGMGFDVDDRELLTPAQIARDYLAAHSLSPFLVVHPNLEREFDSVATGTREAVVIGDAGEGFNFNVLNAAFRRIIGGAELVALAKNRYFQDADGALSLDAGPFVAALEFASGREAVLLGKPSAEFLKLAAQGLGLEPRNVVMIGDDAQSDIGGAMDIGMQAILVRTGKYRAGDEDGLSRPPLGVDDSIVEAVERIGTLVDA